MGKRRRFDTAAPLLPYILYRILSLHCIKVNTREGHLYIFDGFTKISYNFGCFLKQLVRLFEA